MQHDIDSVRQDYLRLNEVIKKELEGMSDADKAQFLRSESEIISQRLSSLDSSSSSYLQRYNTHTQFVHRMWYQQLRNTHSVSLKQSRGPGIDPCGTPLTVVGWS